MKKLFTLALLLSAIVANAQTGKIMTAIGGTLVVGSTAYWMLGEPDMPMVWNQESATVYQNKLQEYRRNRVAFAIGSSAVLITGLLLNIAEVKPSKNTALNLAPNGVQFTLVW